MNKPSKRVNSHEITEFTSSGGYKSYVNVSPRMVLWSPMASPPMVVCERRDVESKKQKKEKKEKKKPGLLMG